MTCTLCGGNIDENDDCECTATHFSGKVPVRTLSDYIGCDTDD